MQIKKLLDLSEASVTLDTPDLENELLQTYLKKNNIKAKTAKDYGAPSNSSPGNDVEFSGTKRALEMMIHRFFGDDDLKDFIEEEKAWMKDSGWQKSKARDPRGVVTHLSDVAQRQTTKDAGARVYVKTGEQSDHEATIVRDGDGKVIVRFDIVHHGGRRGVDRNPIKFDNINKAAKWLEDLGYDLRDLHEDSNPNFHGTILHTYTNEKADSKVEVFKMEDNSILVQFTIKGKKAGPEWDLEFPNINAAMKWLESANWKLKEIHEDLDEAKSSDSRDEDLQRLEELQGEMLERLDEMKSIIKTYKGAYTRANAYWLNTVKLNLTHGGSMYNYDDTVKEIGDEGNE